MMAKAGGMLRVTLRLFLTAAALGTAGLALMAWIDAPHAWQPAGLAAAKIVGPLTMALVVGTIPAVIRLIDSPKRAMRDVLFVISAAGIVLAIAAGSAESMMLSTITLIALMLAGRLWSQLSDRRATVRGWTLLGAAGIAALALLFFDRPRGFLLLFFAALLVAAVAAAVWGLVLVVRNAPLPLESDRGPLRRVYLEHGAAGVTPFALMQDKRWFWSRDRKAFLAYGLRAGVAVVLGPGVGPAASVDALHREFRAACRGGGWKLGFYQVSDTLAQSLGWGVRRQIGSEAIVDLRSLTLDGPAMAKLRHEVSRGQRNGVTIRIMSRSDLTPVIRDAMGSLAASWLGRHPLGEMAFSVGCRADQPDAPTSIGLAYDRDGTLVAYCSWLSLPGSCGVALDEIRRTGKTPAGAMDLLLFTCMKQFAANCAWASLGLAPVAAEPANRRAALGERALHRLGIASVSASLVSFKAKFQPRWEPRYIVAERAADWPAVAAATFLLHYPRVEQRLHRVFPQVSWRRQARITAALTGALLAAGLSGIVVAAAQSREGHPLYEAHVAAVQIGAVLPQTGGTASPGLQHRSKLVAHRVHGGPDGLGGKTAVHRATASRKVVVFTRQATSPTAQKKVSASLAAQKKVNASPAAQEKVSALQPLPPVNRHRPHPVH
jgi:lysylphosphatidylglycerol synthetase-like protein (DUF2156 family)